MGCSNSTQNNVTPAQKPGDVGGPPQPVKQLTDQQVEEKKNLDASLSLSLPEAESELLGSTARLAALVSHDHTGAAGTRALREQPRVSLLSSRECLAGPPCCKWRSGL